MSGDIKQAENFNVWGNSNKQALNLAYMGLSLPETTDYDDYIVKQAKKLYKNQKVSPEEINLRHDAPKLKDMFKEITGINFNTFVAYRHLIAIAITFQNDHRKICGSLPKKSMDYSKTIMSRLIKICVL